ncbi:MAG TPA: PilN domain-containing protein [Gaiellaceae bacterium]|jgi:Tfp pilus assembly protein PilN
MRAVNLLPRETKEPRKRLTVVGQLTLVAPFVVVGLVVVGYLLSSSSLNSKRSTLQALQDELASLPQPAARQPQQNPALAAEQQVRVAALGAALQSRLVWDRVLREISAVLPGDVWLTTMSATSPETPTAVGASATPPAASPGTTTTSSTTTTTTATTPAPAPPPAPTAQPMSFAGYTYSQEGVARLLSRLAVVPALENVKLVQSSQAEVNGQSVVSFSIQADVRPQETG